MRLVRIILPPVLVFVVVTALLELTVRIMNVPKYILPAPSAVFRTMGERREDLLGSLASTALAAGAGFLLSALVGILIAMILSTSRWVQRAFYPYTVFFQTVPIVAIAPLLVIWFGFGLRSVALSALIASIFPVIANTLTGLLSTDPALRDLFRLYGASRLQSLVKLKLPSALPNIVTGLRIAAGLSVIGTIVGEFVAGVIDRKAGLGILVMIGKRNGNTDLIFAAVLVASLLGLAMLWMINALGWLLLRRWHASEKT
ncbi:MAG TPA: ABC transporter permease [Tepidisphaeraceae bacterium]|jgi:NitT/TauT family transport system permease protein